MKDCRRFASSLRPSVMATRKTALKETIDAFPDEADLSAQMIALTERQAAQLLTEAEIRAEAGQYQLARGILSQFPTESVGRVTKIQVQDALEKLNESAAKAESLVEQLKGQVALAERCTTASTAADR